MGRYDDWTQAQRLIAASVIANTQIPSESERRDEALMFAEAALEEAVEVDALRTDLAAIRAVGSAAVRNLVDAALARRPARLLRG